MSRLGLRLNRPTSVRFYTTYYSGKRNLAIEFEEEGVRIALTVVDTPGFGDSIDNEFAYVHSTRHTIHELTRLHRFQEIMSYIERQYDDILAEQSRIKRNPRFKDNRVHALLYFIPPTGHAYVLYSYLWFKLFSKKLG